MIKIKLFKQINNLPTIQFYNENNEQLSVEINDIEETKNAIFFVVNNLQVKEIKE
jgi:hypothetical protein